MRVLLVSQYFAPEATAASLRLAPIAAGLARAGHDVSVVCEIPSHPHGRVHEGFTRRPFVRRTADGYRVLHVWSAIPRLDRARDRLAAYATYAATASAVGALLPRPDVVLASSPPLSVGAVGAALASARRARFVLDVRDLWPEVAVALGEVGPGRVLRAAERLERWLYGRADAITVPTEAYSAQIAAVAGSQRVHIVENGTTREWVDAAGAEVEKAGVGLATDRFVWTYAGNVGLSQALGVAVDAARVLGDGFQFVILGGGTSRADLKRAAADVPAGQVIFRDAVPPAEAMRVMRASDALLVPLANSATLAKTVPVKLYDSCALGRPVVVSAPGEAARLAGAAEAALLTPPEDPEALAGAIRRLADDAKLRAELGTAATAFAEEHLRDRGVAEMERILSGLCA